MRSLLNNDREEERDHLTALPAMDMEHFMYRQGFDDVFHRVAMIPVDAHEYAPGDCQSYPSVVKTGFGH